MREDATKPIFCNNKAARPRLLSTRRSESDLLPLNSPGRGGLSLQKIGLVAYSLNFPLSRNRVADYRPLYSSLVNPGAFWMPKMLWIEGLWN